MTSTTQRRAAASRPARARARIYRSSGESIPFPLPSSGVDPAPSRPPAPERGGSSTAGLGCISSTDSPSRPSIAAARLEQLHQAAADAGDAVLHAIGRERPSITAARRRVDAETALAADEIAGARVGPEVRPRVVSDEVGRAPGLSHVAIAFDDGRPRRRLTRWWRGRRHGRRRRAVPRPVGPPVAVIVAGGEEPPVLPVAPSRRVVVHLREVAVSGGRHHDEVVAPGRVPRPVGPPVAVVVAGGEEPPVPPVAPSRRVVVHLREVAVSGGQHHDEVVAPRRVPRPVGPPVAVVVAGGEEPPVLPVAPS